MFLRASFFDMMLQVGGVTEDTTINHPTTTTTNVTTIIAPQKTTMYPRCETELMFWVLVLDPLETDCGRLETPQTFRRTQQRGFVSLLPACCRTSVGGDLYPLEKVSSWRKSLRLWCRHNLLKPPVCETGCHLVVRRGYCKKNNFYFFFNISQTLIRSTVWATVEM